MTSWRKAFILAQFELKIAALHFLGLFFFSFFVALFFGTSINNYLSGNSALFDFFFIIFFSVFPAWMKPKTSQYQKVNGELWASHLFVMQKQLAIPEDILIKSRFISHLIFSLPMQLFILILMFPITLALQPIMSPLEYIAFSIIWLSFSIYIGLIMAVSDAGDLINVKTVFSAIISTALFLVGLFVVFHIGFGNGVVSWTIKASKNFPILASLISILLAVISIHFWKLYMRKIIKRIDYF